MLRALETGDETLIKQIWERAIFVHGPSEAERFDAYAAESLKQHNPLDVTYALVHFNISHEHAGLGPGTGEVDHIDAKTL